MHASLRILVIVASTCLPLAASAAETWHCPQADGTVKNQTTVCPGGVALDPDRDAAVEGDRASDKARKRLDKAIADDKEREAKNRAARETAVAKAAAERAAVSVDEQPPAPTAESPPAPYVCCNALPSQKPKIEIPLKQDAAIPPPKPYFKK